MLACLGRAGYLSADRHPGPTFAERGVIAAERTLRRHRQAERFLVEVLHLERAKQGQQAGLL